jgi:hypothetical protein
MQFMMAWIAGILEILVPGRSKISRVNDDPSTTADSADYRKPAVF